MDFFNQVHITVMIAFTTAATRSFPCRTATVGCFRFRALRQTSFLPRHTQLLCPSLTSRSGYSRELFFAVSVNPFLKKYLNSNIFRPVSKLERASIITPSTSSKPTYGHYRVHYMISGRKVKASSGSPISLSSFKNKKPVVLFFYPKAGTPGCTKQVRPLQQSRGHIFIHKVCRLKLSEISMPSCRNWEQQCSGLVATAWRSRRPSQQRKICHSLY